MQVILLTSMPNLGELGDEVQVKPGFARNFLIPQGKAVAATGENRAGFELRRAELEQREAQVRAAAASRAERLGDLTVTIARKAGEGGRLFGSVGAEDIAEAVREAGIEMHRGEVRLAEGNLRQTGEHGVHIHLQSGVDTTLTVRVEPEG